MVSVAYLINILCAMIAVSRAEEVTNGEGSEQVDSKWFGMGGWGGLSCYSGYNILQTPWLYWQPGFGSGGCYGMGIFQGGFSNGFFAKATENHSISRRALDSDQLYRRQSEQTVSCINEKGVSTQFLKSDCLNAANALAEKGVSTATYETCTLSLVATKDRVVAKKIPADALEKAVDGILKVCGTKSTAASHQSRSAFKNHDNDVALLLSKSANSKQ